MGTSGSATAERITASKAEKQSPYGIYALLYIYE
jgi:hypothetical protein